MSSESSAASSGENSKKVRGRPFPKGVSGNPSGRPRKNAAADLVRADGWGNVLSGVGTARDKRTHAFHRTNPLPHAEAEDLYRGNDLAGKLVDKLVDEALRKGVNINVKGDSDIGEAIDAQIDELEGLEKIGEAWKWARAFGGSLLLMGADDGREPSEPLQEDAIRRVKWLSVVDRSEVYPARFNSDPQSKGYGLPSHYVIHPAFSAGGHLRGGSVVHASRVIRFDGVPLPRRLAQTNQGWGDSVLVRAHEVLRDFGLTWAAAAALMQDFAQAVFEMEGLAEALKHNRGEEVKRRLEIMDVSRSVLRAIVVSKGESFRREATPLSGLPEVLQQFMLRLAATGDMPVSILFGQAPAGLNATGEGDHESWRNTTASAQTNYLRRRLNQFVRLLLLAKDGPTRGEEPDNWKVSFPPLKELSEKERAEIRESQSRTDTAYISAQVLSPEEVAKSRFGGDEWSGETQLDEELRAEFGVPSELDDAPPAPAAESEAAPAEPEKPAQTKATEPAAPEEKQGDPGPTPAHVPEAVDPTSALNGAQVTALLETVARVAKGEIPRETGVAIIAASFPLTEAQADKIMGSVGRGFVPAAPEEQKAAVTDAAESHVSCVAVFDAQGRMLWGRRKDNNRWTTPCGHVEPGEGPEAGALRELWEEAGLKPRGPIIRLGSGRGGARDELEVHAFLAVVEGDPTTENDPDDELQGWEWVDVSKGLPAEMLPELHVPAERNLLLQFVPALREAAA